MAKKVNIYVDFADEDIVNAAKSVSRVQRMDVVIHTPNATTEVKYEEAKKEKEDGPKTQAIIKSWFEKDKT